MKPFGSNPVNKIIQITSSHAISYISPPFLHKLTRLKKQDEERAFNESRNHIRALMEEDCCIQIKEFSFSTASILAESYLRSSPTNC